MTSTTFDLNANDFANAAPQAEQATKAGVQPKTFWQKVFAAWVKPYENLGDVMPLN